MLTPKTTGAIAENGRLELQYLRDTNPDYINPLEQSLLEAENGGSDLVFSTMCLNPEPAKLVKKCPPLRIVCEEEETPKEKEEKKGKKGKKGKK